MEELRPNEQRAKNAVLLIYIVMIMEVISLISSYFQYDLLSSVANGKIMSMDAAEANDMRERIVGLTFFVCYLISAITFILWFRRAYFNLHQKAANLDHSEGWAAGSWFMPIISLFRPYQIMNEMYEKTKELLSAQNISSNLNTSALGWWWALWIINNLIGQFVFRYSLNADTADELIFATVSSMIGNILGIPLALIAIKVVKDYAAAEPLLHQLKDEEPGEVVLPDNTDLQIGENPA